MSQSIESNEVPAAFIALASTREGVSPMEAWELFGDFSDTFKDVNGFRPRHECLIPSTMDDMEKELKKMGETLNERFMNDKERYELEKKRMDDLLKPAPPISIGDLFPKL